MAEKKKYSPEEIDELRKSLSDLEFSEEEISNMISKAEDEVEEVEDEEEEVDEEEVSKAYHNIMKMKTDLDKAMGEFLDRFGKVPGFKTPDFDVKDKAIETDIEKVEKVEKDEIIKSFDGKFENIEKAFESQNTINEQIMKSLEGISETVQKIAEAPNPLKGLLGSYGIIEKGEKFDGDGKQVISINNKKAVQDVLLKSLDVLKEEDHKQVVRDEISNFTVTNKLSSRALNIVKKAMNVEFEK